MEGKFYKVFIVLNFKLKVEEEDLENLLLLMRKNNKMSIKSKNKIKL